MKKWIIILLALSLTSCYRTVVDVELTHPFDHMEWESARNPSEGVELTIPVGWRKLPMKPGKVALAVIPDVPHKEGHYHPNMQVRRIETELLDGEEVSNEQMTQFKSSEPSLRILDKGYLNIRLGPKVTKTFDLEYEERGKLFNLSGRHYTLKGEKFWWTITALALAEEFEAMAPLFDRIAESLEETK